MARRFVLREHTADVAVEAHAPTLGEAFAAVAEGMAAAMCDSIPATGGERFSLSARASTRERLLYDYLDALIYERDVRGVLPVDNEASVERAVDGSVDGPSGGEVGEVGDDGEERGGRSSGGGAGGGWTLSASARGVSLDAVVARDLKAVTFSEMVVERTDAEWRAYVVFDV